jgi:hypothetical protein
MRNRIAVVIPFYQTRSGLLKKAVGSALRQTEINDLEILIGGDASPILARAERARARPFGRCQK